jgi:hypothetical protein
VPLNVWMIFVFLLGAAAGALVVSIQRISTLSRIREQFEVELESLVEAELKPALYGEEQPARAKNAPGQAA